MPGLDRVRLNHTIVASALVAEQPASVFSIIGHVRHPGKYELIDDITVGQAIAIAGGLTARGDIGRTRILRTVDGKRIELAAAVQDPVLPDDTIEVRASRPRFAR